MESRLEDDLLVHINAPCTREFDVRVATLAQAIRDFRPTIVTKVSGIDTFAQSSAASDASRCDLDDEDVFSDSRSARTRSDLRRPRTAPNLISANSPSFAHRNGFRRARSDLSSHSASSPLTKKYSTFDKTIAITSPAHKKPRLRRLSDPFDHDDEAAWDYRLGPVHSAMPSTPKNMLALIGKATVTDDEATQSPSQAHPSTTNSDDSIEALPLDKTVVIDLTTPERQATASYPTPLSRPVHLAQSRTTFSLSQSVSDLGPALLRTEIKVKTRSNEIRAPFPGGGQAKYTTHITKTLKKLEVKLKHFQPCFVARDVSVLERGYWHFRINVANKAEVDHARQPPRTPLKLLGSTARRRVPEEGTQKILDGSLSTKDALWTQEELERLWQDLVPLIESGKTGWGITIVRELSHGNAWRIRMFTWGETLAHFWILLYVLSEELTAKLTMQWVDASGNIIIEMSEKRSTSGMWRRYGPEGQGGRWGLG